jgi:hypothetical protein
MRRLVGVASVLPKPRPAVEYGRGIIDFQSGYFALDYCYYFRIHRPEKQE